MKTEDETDKKAHNVLKIAKIDHTFK
jgi:Alpha-kinase family